MVYPKAIYMVEGEPFEVQELRYREDEEKVAYVKRVAVDYFTDAISAKGVWILQHLTRREAPGWVSEQGEVLVAEKVVGFKKIKMGTLENVGSGEVELPQQEMQTTSAWLAVDPTLLVQISPSREELVDGMRALTYLLHHLAPIFLLCDVRDVGAWLGDGSPAEAGVVVTRETQRAQLLGTERFTPTLYLYDSQPGGIGLAERIFEILPELLAQGLATLEACPCKTGCPSCVGPVNEVGRRAKPIALAILRRLVPRPLSGASPVVRPRRAPPGHPPHRGARARGGAATRPPRHPGRAGGGRGGGDRARLHLRHAAPLSPGRRARRAAARADRRAGRRVSGHARAPRAPARPRSPRLLYLDTETTGLAGGTGTYAFLVGVGFVDGDDFEVRQYFMRDLDEEPALLAALDALVARLRGAGHLQRHRLRPAVAGDALRARPPALAERPLPPRSPPRRAPPVERAAPRLPPRPPWSRACSASTGGTTCPARSSPPSTSSICAASSRASSRASSSTTATTSSRSPR